MPRAVAIIPARYHSTRFPGKPLATLRGKPIIEIVHEQVRDARLVKDIFVATDDHRIFERVNNFGGKAIMTSPEHASGTDRVAEVAKEIESDIIINVQGDEPFVKPEMVDDLVRLLDDDESASISTLVKMTSDPEEIFSPDVVKVVLDNEGFALYFSRSPIPYYRDGWMLRGPDRGRDDRGEPYAFEIGALNKGERFCCYKHIGIYGFRKRALLDFSMKERSGIERAERLEQLRALSHGMKIKAVETHHDTLGIDTAEDLRKAEEWLSLSL